MRPAEIEIYGALNRVIDPCSVSVGVPLGLVDMGLIEGVAVSEQGDVTIRLRLTSPGCLMGFVVFEPEIRENVSRVDGTRSVTIDHGDPLTWTEDDISAFGRRRLELTRAHRRRRPPSVASLPERQPS